MGILSQNALVKDVVAVAQFIKAHDGKVTKEDLIMDIFRVSPEHKEAYKSAGDRIARVARATKDTKSPLARQIYGEVYEQEGTIQSIIVGGPMYYYHIPWMDKVGIKPFNAKSVDDTEQLIGLIFKSCDLTQDPVHEIITKMAIKYGYVMGTIAPTIGTLVPLAKTINNKFELAKQCIAVMSAKSNK